MVNVTLLYFDDCPSWQTADGHLHALAEEIGYTIERIEVTTPEQAEQLRFRGSPSIHIDGTDPRLRLGAPPRPGCLGRQVVALGEPELLHLCEIRTEGVSTGRSIAFCSAIE